MAAAAWCIASRGGGALFRNTHMNNIYILDCIPSGMLLHRSLKNMRGTTRGKPPVPGGTGLGGEEMVKNSKVKGRREQRYQEGKEEEEEMKQKIRSEAEILDKKICLTGIMLLWLKQFHPWIEEKYHVQLLFTGTNSGRSQSKVARSVSQCISHDLHWNKVNIKAWKLTDKVRMSLSESRPWQLM